MNTPKTPRSIVTLAFPRRVPALIALAKAIVLGLTGNAAFPTPDPSVAVLNTAIAELEAAESAVTQTRARAPRRRATRNEPPSSRCSSSSRDTPRRSPTRIARPRRRSSRAWPWA